MKKNKLLAGMVVMLLFYNIPNASAQLPAGWQTSTPPNTSYTYDVVRIGTMNTPYGGDEPQVVVNTYIDGENNSRGVIIYNNITESVPTREVFAIYNVMNASGGLMFLNGNPLFQVGATGKVNIGLAASKTVSDDYKLFVEKGILTEKVKVASSTGTDWYDFVFDEDYKLMSLPEVESYIKENKHLPDIPSAEEVNKEGIDLLQMDGKLLQKIEELTLHMIDLKKENEQLKKDISQLKNRLN